MKFIDWGVFGFPQIKYVYNFIWRIWQARLYVLPDIVLLSDSIDENQNSIAMVFLA